MDNKLLTDLPQEEQQEWYADYHQSATIVRGNILNAATALEMSIDLYITNYFTGGGAKSEELMNLIISPRMSFENKVQVLMVLIEKYNAKMIQVNKSIKKDLINIIEERNILAHYPLDTTEIGLQEYYETNNLTFFKFKNIRANDGSGEISLTNSIIYNVSKTESLLNLINKYHLLITTAILDLHTVPPPAN